jgi:hypothetical protein
MKRVLSIGLLVLCLIFNVLSVYSQNPGPAYGKYQTRNLRMTPPPSAETAAEECPVCSPPTVDKKILLYEIDANTGKARQGLPTEYKKGNQIMIVIANLNPYVYRYNISIKQQRVLETALLAFLGQLSPIIGTAITAVNTGAADASNLSPMDFIMSRGIASLPKVSGNCPATLTASAEETLQAIYADFEELKNRDKNLAEAFNKFVDEDHESKRKIFKTWQSAVNNPLGNAPAGDQPNADFYLYCKKLCGASDDFVKGMSSYPSQLDGKLKEFEGSLQRFQLLANSMRSQIEDFRKKYPRICHPTQGGESLLLLIATYAESIIGPVTNDYQTKLGRLRKDREAFGGAIDTINATRQDPTKLRYTRIIGDFDDPTDVTIEVQRRDLADTAKFEPNQPAPYIEEKLAFGGGPRFSISGGMVLSGLERKEFQPVQTFRPDTVGNQVVDKTFIGFKENSNYRFNPMLMLHIRPTNSGEFYLSWGITARKDNEGTDVEYLFGPTYAPNLFERRIMFTGGLYLGKRQDLTGGLQEPQGGSPFGSQVPNPAPMLPVVIPVRKELKPHYGIGITFRIR